MKRSRKILLLTASVLVLLCLVFYGYIRYQRHVSFHTTIPKQATSLVRLNVYALYRSMLSDYFEQEQQSGPSMIDGLDIPSDIFLYTLKGRNSTTLFTSLKIVNEALFKETVTRWGLTPSAEEMPAGVHFAANASATFAVAYSHDRAFFSFSYSHEEVRSVLIDLLQGKEMVPVNESSYAAIAEQEGHIVLLSEGVKGAINFQNGYIRAGLSLSVPGLTLPEQVSHQATDQQALISMWLYAGGQSLLGIPKQITVDSLTINSDSIRNYLPQGFELLVTDPVVQRDSVVTYEYNDDFEKVPTITLQESRVPGMQAAIHCGAAGLYSYLQRQGIINNDSNLISRKIFPLYQLYAFPEGEYLYLATTRQLREPVKREKSNDFFGLEVNFVQIGKQQEFSLLKPYIKKLDRLEAKALKDKDGRAAMEATLWFNDKSTNVAWQLLESL